MNKVILIGRLTKKPELQYTAGQTAVTKFTLAVDRYGKDKGADFMRVTAFGKTAEQICQYMDKGRQIAVEGRIQTGSYEKDGKTIYTTDIIIDNKEFLSSGGNGESQRTEPRSSRSYDDFEPAGYSRFDEDLPF